MATQDVLRIETPMTKRRWLRISGIGIGLLILAVVSGHILYIDFPYRGKVIDKETKRPIEGAAVVAIWHTESPAVHPISSFYEAKETLTDAEGNFTTPWIWGGTINPLPRLWPPLFIIFKPGYEAYDRKRLASRWFRTIVEQRRLTTKKEKMRNLPNVPSDVPREKCPNLIKLWNIEYKNSMSRRRSTRNEKQ